MSIYVLELEHGCYFVGCGDADKALEEHREGVEPWTTIHRPVRVATATVTPATVTPVTPVTPMTVTPAAVDAVVREWMRRVGMDRVRGGSWCGVRLTDAERCAIRQGGERQWCVVG